MESNPVRTKVRQNPVSSTVDLMVPRLSVSVVIRYN